MTHEKINSEAGGAKKTFVIYKARPNNKYTGSCIFGSPKGIIKRIFDILCSLTGLVILLPFFLIISIIILIDSRGGVFYRQMRVGKKGKDFLLYKFRTMRPGSEEKGLLTVGARDGRITGAGIFLRKYKLDELPQLFNVLIGDMSLVGPRPEVRKYVNLYTTEQRTILEMKPGITDYASIEYVNENELLDGAKDAEELYVREIMPRKIELNRKYMMEQSLGTDLKIIMRTLHRIL